MTMPKQQERAHLRTPHSQLQRNRRARAARHMSNMTPYQSRSGGSLPRMRDDAGGCASFQSPTDREREREYPPSHCSVSPHPRAEPYILCPLSSMAKLLHESGPRCPRPTSWRRRFHVLLRRGRQLRGSFAGHNVSADVAASRPLHFRQRRGCRSDLLAWVFRTHIRTYIGYLRM